MCLYNLGPVMRIPLNSRMLPNRSAKVANHMKIDSGNMVKSRDRTKKSMPVQTMKSIRKHEVATCNSTEDEPDGGNRGRESIEHELASYAIRL